MSEKRRIGWVDFSKGIAIILVIVGHTINNPFIRGVIFSIHMPLFFIASGYTSKCSEDRQTYCKKVARSAIHLLIPAYCIFVTRLLLYIIVDHESFPLPNILLTPVFASGIDVTIGDEVIPAFGMIWFLVVLFGMRSLYDLIQLKVKGNALTILCIVLSLVGMVIGKFMQLPFCLDLDLATLAFFHFGQKLKSFDFYASKLHIYILSAAVWGAGLGICGIVLHKYLELASRTYPLYPLSYVTALAGCMFVYLIGAWVERVEALKHIFNALCFLGKHSMVLYTIHAYDTVVYKLVEGKYSPVVLLLLRLLVDLLIMYGYVWFRQRLKKETKSNC